MIKCVKKRPMARGNYHVHYLVRHFRKIALQGPLASPYISTFQTKTLISAFKLE